MSARSAELRDKIALEYRKHCSDCTGSCCNLELEEGFIAFAWELDRISKDSSHIAQNIGNSVRLMPFSKGSRCHFSGSNACGLTLAERPLDCLTYPVYPKVRLNSDGTKIVEGLAAREGCRSLGGILSDSELLGHIKEFWELEIEGIKAEELTEWCNNLGISVQINNQ